MDVDAEVEAPEEEDAAAASAVNAEAASPAVEEGFIRSLPAGIAAGRARVWLVG